MQRFQIVSLLDMVDLAFPELVKVMGEMMDMACMCRDMQAQPIILSDKDHLLERLEKVKEFASVLDLDATLSVVNDFIRRLGLVDTLGLPDHGEVANRLVAIRRNLEAQLASRKIGFVPKDKVKYWQVKRLFGDVVYSKFKEARIDLQEAGNCFAGGQNTACVFHLMQVMEVGLRRLAKRFKVRNFSAKTWGVIIQEIDDALSPRRRNPRTRAAAVKYDPALAYFRNAKHGWRDRVCHSSVTYSEHQAVSLLTATEGFMRELAAMF